MRLFCWMMCNVPLGNVLISLKKRHYKVRNNPRFTEPFYIVRDCFVPRNDVFCLQTTSKILKYFSIRTVRPQPGQAWLLFWQDNNPISNR